MKNTVFLLMALTFLVCGCDSNPPAKKDIEKSVKQYYELNDTVKHTVQDVNIINIGSRGSDSIRWQITTIVEGTVENEGKKEAFVDTLQLNFYRDDSDWQSITVPK